MVKAQNSQRYLNKMAFESMSDVLFVQKGIRKIYFFLIFKHVVKRSHSEACCFKRYTLLYIYLFIFFYFFFILESKQSG